MIAPWMLYSIGVGLLLTAGAAALDAALRPLRRPTRWGWAAALALTVALPVAARFAPRRAPERPSAAKTAAANVPVRIVDLGTAALPKRFDVARLDRPLVWLWGGSSAAVALTLAAMAGALAVRRRRWTEQRVDGVPVLVSPETGPAVVGLVRGRIVLPAWAVAGDAEARALVLEHEREHLRAGDPRLLAAGLVCAALMPWNPAVWWQLRRLRLAVEVDCDARVLRRRGDVRAYGQVLLEVGRRATRTRLPAAAFSEPASSLERRIRIMTAPRVRRPLARAAGLGALAALLVAAACEAPQPVGPSVEGSRRVYTAAPDQGTHSRHSLAQLVNKYFPDVAANGLGDDQAVAFVLSDAGEVVSHELIRMGAAHTPGNAVVQALGIGGEHSAAVAAVDPATIAAMDVMKEPAGRLGPTPVRVLVIQLKAPGDATRAGYERRNTEERRSGTTSRMHLNVKHMPDGTSTAAAITQQPLARGDAVHDALQAAIARYYTPELKAAGVHGQVRIEYVVGADGKPTDVSVTADDPALVPVGRAVFQSLSIESEHPGARRGVVFAVGLGRTPATER
jgi:beta-lactamase regulating signal transducer with metallopeptidase domain